jgi:thiosulfate dehydrogenase [quinone] large subunit
MTSDHSDQSHSKTDLGPVFGVLVLRLWLGTRAVLTGVEKYAGSSTSSSPVTINGSVNSYGLTDTVSTKVYSIANYHGVPKSLYDKFLTEPLLPDFFLKIYDQILGPALIALGIALLIGFASRFTLLAMGVLYTSLTIGLILTNENSGVAWLAIHIVLVAMMLFQAKHNRFELTSKWKI